MTLILLICLLALTSSAFGRSAYGGGYGVPSFPQTPSLLSVMRDQTIQRPLVPAAPVVTQTYGQAQPVSEYGSTSSFAKTLTVPNLPSPIQGYGSVQLPTLLDQRTLVQVPLVTEADILCRGQLPETVIPLDEGRRFVVCLADGKGVEQQCPKGLFYNLQSRRCERKPGSLGDVCASQPCLNGGQCVPTDVSYQCQCAPGFDGTTCELDARICQTQYPCGQTPDVRCQSFRLGAALPYICIFQGGAGYGLNAQQIQPSPCQGSDGTQALVITDKGFIMCDGERMFVESCPGGTIWDDVNKACVWPDLINGYQSDQQSGYGQSSSYGQQKTITRLGYGAQTQLEQPKLVQSYGVQQTIPHNIQQKQLQSYGAQLPPVRHVQQPSIIPSLNAETPMVHQFEQSKFTQSYGTQTPIVPSLDQSKVSQSFGIQTPIVPSFDQSKLGQSFGIQTPIVPSFDQSKLGQSFGIQTPIVPSFDQSRVGQSFGVQTPVVANFDQSKLTQSFGVQTPIVPQLEQPKPAPAYSAQITIPSFDQFKSSSFGVQQSIPRKFEQPQSFTSGLQRDTVTVQQPSGY